MDNRPRNHQLFIHYIIQEHLFLKSRKMSISYTQVNRKSVIAVLVSGGDCQIINYILAKFIKHCNSYKLYFVFNGFKGLYENKIMSFESIKGKLEIDPATAGAFIGSSRFPDVQKHIDKCKENLRIHNIDHLVVLGGDGSSKAAKAIGCSYFIPCTIDNDIGSCYSFGYITSFEQIYKYFKIISPSVEAMGKGLILEAMGNGSNQLSMISFLSTYSDYCFLNPLPFETLRTKYIDQMISLIQSPTEYLIDNTIPNKLSSKIILAEKYLNKSEKEKLFKMHRYEMANYFQRSGNPVYLERKIAVSHHKEMLKNILKGEKQFVDPNQYILAPSLLKYEEIFSVDNLAKSIIQCYDKSFNEKKHQIRIIFKKNPVFNSKDFEDFLNFYKPENIQLIEVEDNFDFFTCRESISNIGAEKSSMIHKNIIFCKNEEIGNIEKNNTVIIPIDQEIPGSIFLWKDTIMNSFCGLIDTVIKNGSEKKYYISCDTWIFEELKQCFDPFINNDCCITNMIFYNKGTQFFHTETDQRTIFVIPNEHFCEQKNFFQGIQRISPPFVYEKTAIDEFLLRLSLLKALNNDQGIVDFSNFWPNIRTAV